MASFWYKLQKGLLRDDLRAIWLLRSHVLIREIGFWLVLLGYDTRTRRFQSAAYLAYALVIFFVWASMIFLWLVSVLQHLITTLPWISPPEAGLVLGSLAILGFSFLELYQVTNRSPLVLSEQDAHLICMTPIDRRLIVLTWFTETWAAHTAWIWIFFAALAGAWFQMGSPDEFAINNVLYFGISALRAASIAVPLSLGVLALIWSIGLWRMRGRAVVRNIHWLPLALIALILAGIFRFGWLPIFHWLEPVPFLIGSILGYAPYITGITIGLLLAVSGVAILWFLSRTVNLARAAEETHRLYSLQAAQFIGRTDIVNDLQLQDQLGPGRSPLRVPVWKGWRVFLWKSILQLRYSLQPRVLFPLAGILSLNIGMAAFQSWDVRIFLGTLWIVSILQFFEPRVQRYFSRWWLNRLLPFKKEWLIFDITLLPVGVVWGAGLVSLLILWGTGQTVPIAVIWLYIISVPGILLCGTLDVLYHAKSNQFIAGLCPGPELLATLFSLLFIFLNSGTAWLLLVHWQVPCIVGMSILVLIGIAGLYGILEAASFRMKHIR